MGKRFTEVQIIELRKNPNVKFVRKNRLSLTFEFRCQVYDAWIKNPSVSTIREYLSEAGFDTRILGKDFINHINGRFKKYGRPSRGKNKTFGITSLNFKTNASDNEYLISTGMFIQGRKGITFSPSFIEVLYDKYPGQSIEEGIIAAGLDPEMIGYQRIYALKKRFDGKEPVRKSVSYTDRVRKKYEEHPYIDKVTMKQFRLSKSFYAQAYPLRELHINEILRAFEINPEDIPISVRNQLGYRLKNRDKPNFPEIPATPQTIRIQRNIVKIMEDTVDEGFRMIGEKKKEMKLEHKKKLCQWIRSLPKEHGYTVTRILSLVGISSSSYYSILSSESYGKRQEEKDRQDDKDIETIRKVMDHKGFKKGTRTICMMMKDVTGQYFNRKKIQRLMRKYGVSSGIRVSRQSRVEARKQLEQMKKPNLLKREFFLHHPGKIILSDVTYLDYGNGLRAYGSAAVDPLTGRCLTFRISESNDLALALGTLDDIDNAQTDGALFHTDQGTLYLNPTFQNKLKEMGYAQSMSKRGNCWDNAPQESFFGHFKDEVDYGSCSTIEELKTLVEEYVKYYNFERRQWGRNKMTPLEFESYINGMDEEEYRLFHEDRQKKYTEMKEEAARKAKQRYETLGI